MGKNRKKKRENVSSCFAVDFLVFPYLGSQVAGLIGPHGLYTMLAGQLYAVLEKEEIRSNIDSKCSFAAKVTAALPP